jgi:hypothetical protein
MQKEIKLQYVTWHGKHNLHGQCVQCIQNFLSTYIILINIGLQTTGPTNMWFMGISFQIYYNTYQFDI